MVLRIPADILIWLTYCFFPLPFSASKYYHGRSISGLSNGFDGQVRPQGPGIDIGADEYQLPDASAPAAILLLND